MPRPKLSLFEAALEDAARYGAGAAERLRALNKIRRRAAKVRYLRNRAARIAAAKNTS